MTSNNDQDAERNRALELYRRRLRENWEMEEKMKETKKEHETLSKQADKTEDHLNMVQNTGQFIGEILKAFPDDKYIVKTINGSRYLVHCKKSIDKSRLKVGTRVALDFTTLTIMRILPHKIDPQVYNMMTEPPRGVLLYGPPGTGKTLLARAIACNIEATFLKIVASSIVDKYIGESARVVREMFAYAREHEPCIIFIDEIDAIGGKRTDDSSSSDREVHRTLMELLNQIDGFDELGRVKVIMATNRPDVLDPALLRPGRLDRKIEIPLPNESGRVDILKIHSKPMTKKGEIEYEALAKITDGFNGADLRNVCTEAGMFAIRDQREYTVQEDFMQAARKIKEGKKLESKLDYNKI